ncbi:MAG: hypothetical protein RIS70_179 [Planctomycetota bacterium]|jgi:hypothetical protein
MRLLSVFGFAILAIGISFSSSWISAQENPPANPPASPPAKSPEGGGAETGRETVIREQSIYIPYAKLRETFEKEGRGVFLPYEKFQELWKAARGREEAPVPAKSPEGALITDIDSLAVAEAEVVRVTAKLNIELLSKGWHRVPIRLGDSAIIQARLGDEPARLLFDAQQGYSLLIEHTGDKPRQVSVSVEYAKAFAKNPGQNSVTFEAPQAPVNRWQIRIPQTGTKITVQPMIAASEIPARKIDERPVEETQLQAFVGAASSVRVDWTAKAEGATGLTALVHAQVQQMVGISEGAVRTRVQIAYDISRAELNQLMIDVPADQKVVNVFDPNVRQWEVKAEADRQRITVQLFQPARGTQNLVVELERFLEDMNQKELVLPVLKAVGAERQQGIVVVSVASALRAEVLRRVGLTQLGSDELPESLKASKWDFAYRYAALPFDLAVATEKVSPRIRVTELVEAYLEPEQLSLELLAIYQIERAGVFQFEIDIPEGFEVRDVRGVASTAAGAQPAPVDSYAVTGEKKTRLVANLSQRALGQVGLLVQLRRPLEKSTLLTPGETATEIPLPVPRVAPGMLEAVQGRLVVYAPESLRVNLGRQEGARAVPVAEAMQGLESMRAGRFPGAREVLAMAYTQQPVQFSLAANRRQPDISVRQLLAMKVQNQSVEYEATFFYDIRYSSVKNLQIDLPIEVVKSQVRNESEGIRERVVPADEGEDAGRVRWSFTGDAEFLGQQKIRLTWKQVISELEVGKPVTLALPNLSPVGVNRATGQVVVAKAESLDIHPTGTPSGVRPIDPQHDLFPESSMAGAARAFEFQEPWSLSLEVARYKLEEVKRTSIEQGIVRMVVTRSRKTSVQAIYRARSARQRLAIRLPAEYSLDTQPLRIDGKPQSLERGDKEELFIPLTGQSPNEPFLIELRYTVPGDHQNLELPEFLEDPAVQQVYLAAYLPQDWLMLGSSGPWTEETSIVQPANYSSVSSQLGDMNQLVSTLTGSVSARLGGNNLATDVLNGFPTDGKMYLFSALRPENAPNGNLHLVAFRTTWVHGVVFAVIALFGLVLTGRAISTRIAWVAVFIIAMVLAAVFAPTFVQQIADQAMFAAVGLVVLVWLVELFLKALVRRPKRTANAPSADSRAAETKDSKAATIESPQGEQASASSRSDTTDPGPDKPNDSGNASSSEQGGSTHG